MLLVIDPQMHADGRRWTQIGGLLLAVSVWRTVHSMAVVRIFRNAGAGDVMTEARDPRSYAIIGAAMEVQSEIGCGFLEHVYQEALELELVARDIPFAREVDLPLFYKGKRLITHYQADFVCFDELIVELKALAKLTNIEDAQLLNYLKATDKEVGLLLNFGMPVLEWKRLVRSPSWSPRRALSADPPADSA